METKLIANRLGCFGQQLIRLDGGTKKILERLKELEEKGVLEKLDEIDDSSASE